MSNTITCPERSGGLTAGERAVHDVPFHSIVSTRETPWVVEEPKQTSS